MKSKEVALNLSTKQPERQKVSIDGVLYEMAAREDFTVREEHWIQEVGRRILQTFVKSYEDVTDTEYEKIEQYIDEVTAKILIGVPEEVFKMLTHSQKTQIIQLFSETVGTSGEAPRSGGTKSSPGSSATTAGQPKTG